MSFEAALEVKLTSTGHTFRSIAKWAYDCGRAVAERELGAPGPCGVSGHTMANMSCYCACHSDVSSRPVCIHCRPELFKDKPDPYVHCAACRREQKLRELLDAFVGFATDRDNLSPHDIVKLGVTLVQQAEHNRPCHSLQREVSRAKWNYWPKMRCK